MSPRDREAHDLILRWCRGARPQGEASMPVMREGVPLMYPDRPRCCVFDLGRSDRLYAGGPTWEAVAVTMGLLDPEPENPPCIHCGAPEPDHDEGCSRADDEGEAAP